MPGSPARMPRGWSAPTSAPPAASRRVTSGDLERLIGHAPTSLRDAVDTSLGTLAA